MEVVIFEGGEGRSWLTWRMLSRRGGGRVCRWLCSRGRRVATSVVVVAEVSVGGGAAYMASAWEGEGKINWGGGVEGARVEAVEKKEGGAPRLAVKETGDG